MVDIVPLALLAFGLVAVLRPEWVAALDRRQKASGTNRHPSDIEMDETYYVVVQVVGIGMALFGVVFTLRSL